MSEPFLAMIEAFSFGFAPKGWALCAGQLLPINQNQALFSLLGTTYGGDGRTTFALPDLGGRVAMGVGNGFTLGQFDGEETHTLTIAELPQHVHPANAVVNGTVNGTNLPGATEFLASAYTSQIGSPLVPLYSTDAPSQALSPNAIGGAGGSQPHENLMPFLVLNYCIALQGVFPTQN